MTWKANDANFCCWKIRDSARHNTVGKRHTGARCNVILKTRAQLWCCVSECFVSMVWEWVMCESEWCVRNKRTLPAFSVQEGFCPGPDVSFWKVKNVGTSPPPLSLALCSRISDRRTKSHKDNQNTFASDAWRRKSVKTQKRENVRVCPALDMYYKKSQ